MVEAHDSVRTQLADRAVLNEKPGLVRLAPAEWSMIPNDEILTERGIEELGVDMPILAPVLTHRCPQRGERRGLARGIPVVEQFERLVELLDVEDRAVDLETVHIDGEDAQVRELDVARRGCDRGSVQREVLATGCEEREPRIDETGVELHAHVDQPIAAAEVELSVAAVVALVLAGRQGRLDAVPVTRVPRRPHRLGVARRQVGEAR